MPRPKNTTESDQSYDIPKRDGVRRAIRLYFPEGKVPTSPVPTILSRTRYGREWVYNPGEREGGYDSFRQSGFVVCLWQWVQNGMDREDDLIIGVAVFLMLMKYA